MRRPTVQDPSRRTHSNKFRHHEAATDRFGRPAEHRCGPQQRTIARTNRKSGEYRHIRGPTYCPGAAIGVSIWRIPINYIRILRPVRLMHEPQRTMNSVASTVGACVVAAFLIGCLVGSEFLRELLPKRQNPDESKSHAAGINQQTLSDSQREQLSHLATELQRRYVGYMQQRLMPLFPVARLVVAQRANMG
jgi:hypothetical protein